MTNRRKFLVGLGSLAAGGAAAMGTGAFSTSQAKRNVTIDVVGDQSGNIEFVAEGGSSDEFVEFDDTTGEFRLTFDEIDGSGAGQGINANSIHYFNDLFSIRNYSPDGPVGFYFDREAAPDEITFYNGGDGPIPNDYFSITGDSLDNLNGSGGNSIIDSQVNPNDRVGEQSLLVDVQIDLRDSGKTPGEVIEATDAVVLHAETALPPKKDD